MGNLDGYDASQYEPRTYEPVPSGEYEVAIVDTQIKPTKAGDGKYLNVELQVISGQYAGRKMFDKLNLWNPSAQAVEIARGTLSSICRAVGVLTPTDSSELHGKPLRVRVTVKDDGQFAPTNVVRSYKATGTASGPSPTRTAPANPMEQPAPDELPF